MIDHEIFKNAGSDEHRPVVFWSLNHELIEEEISWQIAQMADKGVGGFFMHSRSGLLTPYMSKRWLDVIEFMVKEAEKHSLKAWLYDEDPYPSGIAGGKVIADHPEYKSKQLAYENKTVSGPGKVKMDVPMSRIIKAVAVKKENGHIIETVDIIEHMGILRTQWTESRPQHSYYPTTEHDAIPHYRADTSDPYYHLDWEVPKGEWTITIFYQTIRGKHWLFESYTDLLNPDAVDYFIKTTHEEYKKRLGKYFGNVIPGIFTDEGKYLARPLVWTDDLDKKFKDMNGYDIDRALLAMTDDFFGANRYRKDYWHTITQIYSDSYGKRMREWCDKNALLLTGHISPEEEPVSSLFYAGDLMKVLKHFSIPGTDIITYMAGDKKHPILNLGPKLASSVSRQWAEGKALCESFAVTEWQLSISDMILITNWLYSLGINMIVPHVFSYSIDGRRKKDAGPSQFYQATYWDHYKIYSDFVARLGYILADTKPAVDTALIYPMRSIMSAEGPKHDDAIGIRDKFVYLFDFLVRNHIQFDLVSEDDFDNAVINEGSITVGKCSYKNIVMPAVIYIKQDTVDMMSQLGISGCYIAIEKSCLDSVYVESEKRKEGNQTLMEQMGKPEEYIIHGNAVDGFSNTGLDKVLYKLSCGVSITGLGADEVILNRHIDGDIDIFFLSNISKQKAVIDLTLPYPSNSMTRLLDPVTGDICIVNTSGGIHDLVIWPGTSVFVITGDNTINSDANILYDRDNISETIRTRPDWDFLTQKRNVLILDRWLMKKTDEDCSPFDVMTYGWEHISAHTPPDNETAKETVWYRTSFNASDGIRDIGLLLEDSAIFGEYEIYFNGRKLDDKKRIREFDCMNIEYSIKDVVNAENDSRLYGKGTNIIAIKAINTARLNQPLRLLGRFRVELKEESSLYTSLTGMNEKDSICIGDWTHQGYPHYSGAGVYNQEIEIEHISEDKIYVLKVDVGKDLASVYINGIPAGVLVCEPYTVDISDKLTKGKNRICISVINTTENILYGTRRPSGLLGPVSIFAYKKQR